MSQFVDSDIAFAPIDAEQNMEAAMMEQQMSDLIEEALSIAQRPNRAFTDIPSVYDEKLRQLIDAVPVE